MIDAEQIVSQQGASRSPDSPHDARHEQRITIDSLIFPFLGSRAEDHAFFQYLPIDISSHGLQIIIPKWVVNRERLRKEDRINLHVPFRLDGEVFNEGIIAWTRWDDEVGGQRCGVTMVQKVPAHYPLYIDLGAGPGIGLDLQGFDSADMLLLQLIHDAILLKKGVRIYLKHLVSYFSRIAEVSADDYRQLKVLLFKEMDDRVKANQASIEALYEQVRDKENLHKEMARFVDLEELRGIMESEIAVDVLRSALASEAAMPLLNAIKILEKKQYANYNAIVMLYIQSL